MVGQSYGRSRRSVLVAAGRAALIAGPGVLWLAGCRSDQGSTPASAGTASETSPSGRSPVVAPEPAHPDDLRIPMQLRPAWLPDGLLEYSRSAQRPGTVQARAWASQTYLDALAGGHSGPLPSLPNVAMTWSPTPSADPTTAFLKPPNTTVNGRPALTTSGAVGLAGIGWLLDDGLMASLIVGGVADPAPVIRRIAESVGPDTATACETALRFGWLPPGLGGAEQTVTVSGGDGAWRQQLQVGSNLISALLTSGPDESAPTPGPGITPTRLRGRAGLVVSGTPGLASVVLDGGRRLQVTSTVTGLGPTDPTGVIRMVDAMVIGPDPYLDWIGH